MSDLSISPVSEFYAPRAARDLGDPALDPPCTIRVQGGEDRHVRLFDPHARRAVLTDDRGDLRWIVVAGTEPGEWLTDAQVRDWTVVPALFVAVPWTRTAGRIPHEGTLAPAERGDMDVDSFRG